MNRVAAVMMTGIAAGAGIGVAIFEMIALAGIGAGMLRGGVLPTGSDLWLFVVGVAVAGATGAVVATAAAVGAIVALVLFDHWGERPTLSRAVIGGLGAAAGAAVLMLVYGSGVSATAGAWVLAAGVLVSGLLAGGGLYLSETRMRSDPRLPPVP